MQKMTKRKIFLIWNQRKVFNSIYKSILANETMVTYNYRNSAWKQILV